MSNKTHTTACANWRPRWDSIKVQYAFLIFLIPLMQNARAADITFDPIAVNVQNLKPMAGQHISVVCAVLDVNNQSLSVLMPGGTPHPTEGTPDDNGNFSGTLSAALTFMNPNDFFRAKTYKCRLWARFGGTSRPIEIGDGSQWWHAKSGNLSVEGPIP